MFDEMVGNCTPPCDVFSSLTQSQLNKLFDEYKKLTKEDAQFMIDFMAKNSQQRQANKSESRRFNTLFEQMAKALRK
jgi:ferric iron reductase protein FhuF